MVPVLSINRFAHLLIGFTDLSVPELKVVPCRIALNNVVTRYRDSRFARILIFIILKYRKISYDSRYDVVFNLIKMHIAMRRRCHIHVSL